MEENVIHRAIIFMYVDSALASNPLKPSGYYM
jgi:hypothetical protein